jgi:hypothetical protein
MKSIVKYKRQRITKNNKAHYLYYSDSIYSFYNYIQDGCRHYKGKVFFNFQNKRHSYYKNHGYFYYFNDKYLHT